MTAGERDTAATRNRSIGACPVSALVATYAQGKNIADEQAARQAVAEVETE